MDFVISIAKSRFFRFLVSGGIATGTHLLILFVLVHFAGMWYLSATVLTYCISIAVSFTLQKIFTFNDYSKHKIPQQTMYYFGIQLMNICINTFLMYVAVDMLHIHYLVSQVILAGCIALYSFFLYRYIFSISILHTDKSADFSETQQTT